MSRSLTSRWFDLCGALCLMAMAAVVAADIEHLGFVRSEAPLELSAADLEQGWRPGLSWFGLYLNNRKVGFARVERRLGRDGPSASNHVTLRPVVLGAPIEVDADLSVELDSELRPRSFELTSTTAGVAMTASGRRIGEVFTVEMTIGAGSQHFELPAAGAWTDLGLRPAFLRSQPRPGERREIRQLDPLGLRTVSTTIEYVGVESIAVVGQELPAHHLRHTVEGQTFDVWVNDLGEVLEEQMPLGLTALRESEASATYGFGRGAPPLAESEIDLETLEALMEDLPSIPGVGR